MSSKNQIFLIVTLLLAISIYSVIRYNSNNNKIFGGTEISYKSDINKSILIFGKWGCLPPEISIEGSTECAYGVKVKDKQYIMIKGSQAERKINSGRWVIVYGQPMATFVTPSGDKINSVLTSAIF